MKRFKSLIIMYVILGLLVIFTGCPKTPLGGENTKPKGMMYFSFFDTVSYVYSYAGDTDDEFKNKCAQVSDTLGHYHELFDIYYEYSGVNNLKTINDNAGQNPVKVDKELIDFLVYAKQLYTLTNGEMNVMMGAVLKPWHDARVNAKENPSQAAIPDEQTLLQASLHTDINSLIIDEENQTVFISDPLASIDVGALGKGYATQKAADLLRQQNADGYVLNIGGNICTIGKKPDGSGWKTGLKDPRNSEQFAIVLEISDVACVTSGDYERFFTVGGKKYHHIIDKDTLMPSTYFSSVTILTADSGLADALSTALFAMSYEDGLKLVNQIGNVQVVWITTDGVQYYTDGIQALIRK